MERNARMASLQRIEDNTATIEALKRTETTHSDSDRQGLEANGDDTQTAT